MRKFLLGLALLAPSICGAQTPYRSPTAYNTGPIVTCVAADGSGTARCIMAGQVLYDASGNPLGTASNPIITSSSGSNASGNTTDVQGSGSLVLATANATYTIALSGGRNTVGFTITGLTGSGATLTAERSNDAGTTWSNANTTESSATSSLSPTLTADGQARVGVAGATNIRLRVSTAGTGTATVAYNATTAAGPVFLTSLLPSTANPGTNVIGGINNQMVAGVTIATGTGASNTGTQRMVLSSDSVIANTAFALNAGTNSIGTVGLNAGTNAIGSITNTGFNVNNFPATQAVSGTVTANGQGAVTTAAPSYTSGNQAALSLTTAGALRTDASATTQPISAASLPLPAGAATSANQSTQITAEQGILAALPTSLLNGSLRVRPIGLASAAPTFAVQYVFQTPTTNDAAGYPTAVGGYYTDGTNAIPVKGETAGADVVLQPVATASAGITPTTVQGATSNVLKNAPGNVYSVNVVNSTVAGFLVIYNATAAPASGTAISAANGLYCMPIAASLGFRDTFQVPIYASTGATLLMTTSCTAYNPIGTAPITLTGQAK